MRAVIQNFEELTEYRFLYRDALIANINVDIFADDSNFFSRLEAELKQHNLGLDVDRNRKRVIIFKQNNKQEASNAVHLSGQVLDAITGERLPYAVITWQQNGQLRGLSTNESGAYSFTRNFDSDTLDLTCSYTGYKKEVIQLQLNQTSRFEDVTCRLEAERYNANQLIIVESGAYGDINSNSASIVDLGSFSPMGEISTVSALQSLPSVAVSPLLSKGVFVRGSPPDGFRVLIDDITIYNQSHLFGLIDSFNGDVLQRGGFYYDVAPAKIPSQSGGTLSLVTKTGSLDKFSGSAGLSNSSFQLTLNGPIVKGKSSWLLSARKSYMNSIDWFNNAKLTRWGLNVRRPAETLAPGLVDLESYLVRNGKTSADFYDVHGKVYFEGTGGNRLILSGYLGGDGARYSAERLYREMTLTNPTAFVFRPVNTNNDLLNGAVSVKYTGRLSGLAHSSSVAGLSIYSTNYGQKDFIYIKTSGANQTLNAFIFPFQNKSVLNDFSLQQYFDINASNSWFLSTGISYNYYLGQYAESSFDRPGYLKTVKSNQLDVFGQTDFTGWKNLSFFTGFRAHYYSNGQFFRVSPRLKFKFFPEEMVSFGGGFSRNYQFINQISLSNNTTNDVWILTDKNQLPTSINNMTLGFYLNTGPYLYAQIEGYMKNFNNLRLHEVNTFSLTNTFGGNPWLSNYKGNAMGLEYLIKSASTYIELTQTFSISKVMLSNPLINNGKEFYADWDRKVDYSAALGIHPGKSLSLFFVWSYATGTPNKFATFGVSVGGDKRLGNYSRTDIVAEYKKDFGRFNLSFSASAFNLFNTKSPWYRDLNITLNQNTNPNQITGTPIDVYDMGFQPSFNIKVGF